MLLEGKVAIVTGSGRGIGRATARLLAREGAAVVVAERNAEIGAATARDIEASGGRALFVQADVSRSAEVEALVRHASEAFGGIDLLVNNAGVDVGRSLLETSEEEWDWLMGINLRAHFLLGKAVVPHMQARGGGAIVNISSILALASLPGSGAYCASKAGVLGLTRSMALEWGPLGIRVNAVLPGGTDTDMMWMGLRQEEIPEERRKVEGVTPLGRVADPQEIAQAVLWLCSPLASFASGSLISVDGGVSSRAPSPR